MNHGFGRLLPSRQRPQALEVRPCRQTSVLSAVVDRGPENHAPHIVGRVAGANYLFDFDKDASKSIGLLRQKILSVRLVM
jgi:hypothetical protein